VAERPGPAEEIRLSFDRYSRLVRDVLGVSAAVVSVSGQDAHASAGASGLPAPWPQRPWAPLMHAVRQQVIEGAVPMVVPDVRKDEHLAPTLSVSGPNPVAVLAVPLTGAGRVVGAMCALGAEPRAWTDRDVHLLTGLGAACSSELDLRDSRAEARARQHEAESAREAAEQDGLQAWVLQQRLQRQSAVSRRSARHSRLLLAMSEALTATTTVDSVIEVVQEAAAGYLDAESAHFEVATTGSRSTTGSSTGSSTAGPDREHALTVALSGALPGRLTLTWATAEDAEPWIHAGRADGPAPAEVEETVAALVHYASTALDRAILLQERRSAAATLQHAMLTTLPVLAEVELAARYVPAAAANQVGGDWYDAVNVPDDGLAFVIGDVAGHDIEAAATMGQVRSILRGLLVDSPQPPAQMITRLDAALARLGMPTCSSLVLAMLHEHPADPSARRLSWASAGHPAPVRVRADGGSELLKGEPDLLLGIPLDLPRHTWHADLEAGDTLVLYTDGLIQRPGRRLAEGQQQLMRSAEQHHRLPLAQTLEGILRDLVTDAPDDDCAVLAVRLL
jgi:serine phosphatase RsbU (regulator of sigma subunit)